MPAKRTTPRGYEYARELRKALTPAEARLWAALRAGRLAGIKFRRQHAIGHYIVDFCAPRRKLVIELDGSQHLEQEEYDDERTTFLEARGYKVLRFWNNDVMNHFQNVLNVIWNVLKESEVGEKK